MNRKTRTIRIGKITIGAGAPVAIQSMTNTRTTDVAGTVKQIEQLIQAGCEIVRVAIPDRKSVAGFVEIRKAVPEIPLVADIHFDYRLALAAVEAGADKIRLNPGNMGKPKQVETVLKAAQAAAIPVRIGVNAGSLEKASASFQNTRADALVASAMQQVRLCQEADFHDLVLSVKASDVRTTIESYRKISQLVDYPLHLGITEAGTLRAATVKSAIALGVLLLEGIGDTIRVSITGDPVDEVLVAWQILKALDLRQRGVDIISCPTCSRTRVDLIHLAAEMENRLAHITRPLKIALMGCAVNGPGEARDADIGIAGGKGSVLLFKKGKIVGKVPEAKIINELIGQIEQWQE